MTGALLALVLAGCSGPATPDTGPTVDTGWFTDSGDHDVETCPHRVVDTAPEPGEEGWYWRAPLRVGTASDRADAYQARLVDAEGRQVSTTTTWSETSFTLEVAGGLDPSTGYVLRLRDCTGPLEVPFSTSAYGEPLAAAPGSLAGSTYLVDLASATWLEPRDFGIIVSVYFTRPVLIGVEWADDSMIDLLGAQGWQDELGEVHQDLTEPTFDFPGADFTGSPWLTATAGRVDIDLGEGTAILHDFSLSGTFASDGRSIGGAEVRALGDTRDMGGLVGSPGDPGALCELAASMGVSCRDCPDGEPWCLDMHATELGGALVEGLELVRQEE